MRNLSLEEELTVLCLLFELSVVPGLTYLIVRAANNLGIEASTPFMLPAWPVIFSWLIFWAR